MDLESIIRALRSRCPSFARRIGGAAQFKLLQESNGLAVPCAYVVPLDEHPQESQSIPLVRQQLVESFAVIVVVSNREDEKGQKASRNFHALRAELWAALLGWEPSTRHDGITYEGGQLLHVDRARAWYQFEFGALMEIGPEDGWQPGFLDALSPFDGLQVALDGLDPIVDANLLPPGTQKPFTQPDGRVEAEFTVPMG